MSDDSVRFGVCREGARITVAAQCGAARVTLGMNAAAAGALCANLQAAVCSGADEDFDADFSVKADLEVSRP